MQRNATTLDRLKLLVGFCVARVDWSLPILPLLLLLAFVLASSVPAILWTGALTPIPAIKIMSQELPLPSFANWTGFTANINDNSSYTISTEQGTFSWLPYFNLQGSIIQAARDASNSSITGNGLRSHPKFDRSGFVYTGRSYGMGSSVGLGKITDGFDAATGHTFSVPTTGYRFVEPGLLPRATCIRNESSEFFLAPFPVLPGWALHVFNAMGRLPNNATTMHAAAGLGPDDVVAMAAGTGSDDTKPTHYVALATGNGTNGKYGRLNNIQCEIVFEPRNFSVEVNTTLRTISVLPGIDIPDPAHAENLTARAIRALDILSGVFDITIWVSIIGDTFLHNIENVEARPGVKKDDPMATFTGAKDTLEFMLDNIILAYSSAQLMLYQDSRKLPAEVSVRSVAFGSPRDIYIVFAINFVVCIAYAVVLFYISGGSGIGKFNFTDIKAVIVGASAGGYGIATRVEEIHKVSGTRWLAAEDDRIVGRMEVRIGDVRGNGTPGSAVVLADQAQDQVKGESEQESARSPQIEGTPTAEQVQSRTGSLRTIGSTTPGLARSGSLTDRSSVATN